MCPSALKNVPRLELVGSLGRAASGSSDVTCASESRLSRCPKQFQGCGLVFEQMVSVTNFGTSGGGGF